MQIYGVDKTENEVVSFVKGYIANVSNDRNSRFYQTMNVIPSGNYNTLDYGCGWGGHANALCEKGHKVVAIDLSKNEIDICKLVWRDKNIDFKYQDITKFGDEKFDFVISSQVIEHTHNPGTYLYHINRVLKKGAHLIISLPNIMNLQSVFSTLNPKLTNNLSQISQNILNGYKKEQHHIQAWDPIHFTMLSASVGFELVKFIPMEGVPLPKLKKRNLSLNGIRNMSYTMLFELKKAKVVEINEKD